MLVLKRRQLESIKINSDITLTVGSIQHKSILLSIEITAHVILTVKSGCQNLLPIGKTSTSKILSAKTGDSFSFQLNSLADNFHYAVVVSGSLFNETTVRFVFDAPENVSIFRAEIYWRIMENMAAGRKLHRVIQGECKEKKDK